MSNNYEIIGIHNTPSTEEYVTMVFDKIKLKTNLINCVSYDVADTPLSERYSIESFPTFVLLKSGMLAQKFVGKYNIDLLADRLIARVL